MGVMDRPPFLHAGGAAPFPGMPWWQVTSVDGGTHDVPNGVVKFGPFFGSEPRTLTYHLVPNDAVVQSAPFEGEYVADGKSAAIGGDHWMVMETRHPADLAPADDRITAEELTAYAAAWRLGKPWGGQPIPMDYVTRAGTLWLGGEHYRFDASAGPAPLWWVSAPQWMPAPLGIAAGALPAAAAVESPDLVGLATADWRAGSGGEDAAIEVRLIPGPLAGACALELAVDGPPTTVTDGGIYDGSRRVVRWGPFTDGIARVVRCTYPGSARVGFGGQASFGGHPVGVSTAVGTSTGAGTTPHLLGIARAADGALHVVAEGVGDSTAGALQLEYSTDLEHWTPLGAFTEGPTGFAKDATPAADAPRFYRASRPR